MANQFQSAFKVKAMTAAAAVVAVASADADIANRVELVWSRLKGAFAGCCHQSLWSLQEPPLEILNLLVRWTGGRCYMRKACMVQSIQYPEEGRGPRWKKRLHWCQAHGNMCQGIRHSIPDGYGVSISPNIQTRMLLVRTVCKMMLVTKTRWSTMQGCSMSNLSGQAWQAPWVSPAAVCPRPWSTKHSAKWKAARQLWSIWHRSWKWLVGHLTETLFSCSVAPSDWEESFILNLYKSKDEALDRGNYRGLKLTNQITELLKRVPDSYIWVFYFVHGRGTIDIFVDRQLQLTTALFCLRRPWESFWSCAKEGPVVGLEEPRAEEGAVHVIQGMYFNARNRVRFNARYSEELGMGVDVHQGSVLSPLLFILVLEALSREFRTGVPWELLYADDLVLIADTQEEYISKLHVIMEKTKFLVSGVGHDILNKYGKYHFAVCCSDDGNNAILCSRCMLWVHKKEIQWHH